MTDNQNKIDMNDHYIRQVNSVYDAKIGNDVYVNYNVYRCFNRLCCRG